MTTRQRRRAAERAVRKHRTEGRRLYQYHPERPDREPFDPAAIRQLLLCLLCGKPAECVGLFHSNDDATRQVVLTLRRHPTRPFSDPGLVYGLCKQHAAEVTSGDPKRAAQIAQQVEDVLIAWAAR